MAGNALVNIKFAADLKQFSTQMQNANRSIAKMGKKLQNVGTALSIGVTAPLTAFGVASLKNWDAQVKAIAQVETGLKTTGNAVGFTSEQLQKMASDLQNTSLFGDEDILQNATAQLLTFTNIAGEQFARTQQAALDLSTRLGGDLKSASIQLGKALNDPVANLSALSRSGIQFTESQKATINSLVKTNRLAEAQTIILDELEKQYGGSASAAAKAGLGGFKQLANAFGDLQEEIGGIIATAILPLVDKLKGIVASFQALSPETKKWIVILGGVAAAIGPILALAGTILPALMTGFTLLTGPIGLIVAGLTAVGVIVYKNWAPIKAQLVQIANYFIDLYNESTAFRFAVESVVLVFKNMWSVGKFALNAIWSLLKGLASAFVDNFKLIGAIIKAVFTGSFSEIGGIIDKFKNDTKTSFSDTVKNLGNDWQGLMQDVSNNTQKAMANITQKSKIKILAENVDTSAITKKVAAAVSGGAGGGRKKASLSGASALGNRYASGEKAGNLKLEGFDIATPLQEQFAVVSTSLEGMQDKFNVFKESAAEIGNAVGNSFWNMSNRLVDSFGLADDGFQGFVKGLAQTVTDLIAMYLSQSIASSIAGATASGAATGPAAIFTTPAFITTAVSGVLAAFASIPKFQNGGIVGGSSFTGDRLFARVNSGEMILNKRQQNNLSGMLTPANANVNVRLSGGVKLSMRQLYFELQQEEKLLSRTQG